MSTQLKRTISIFVMTMLAALCLASNCHAWWDPDYQYRKQITVTNNDSIQLGCFNLKAFVISAWQQVEGTKAL